MNIDHKKTAYIHLGLPKTGTTSIQSTLAQFFDEGKLDKFDMKFYHASVLPYTVRFRYYNDVECCIKNFKQDIGRYGKLGEHNVIVSFEAFASCVNYKNHMLPELSSSFIPIFKEVFSQYNKKFIIYLRRQDLYWESLVAQRIKARLITTDSSNLYKQINLDYKSLLNDYANEFGKESMIVRVYEREKLYEGCAVKDFLNCIGLDDLIGVSPSMPRENNSLSPKALRVASVDNEQYVLSKDEITIALAAFKKALEKNNITSEEYAQKCYALKFNKNFHKNKHVNLDIATRRKILLGENTFSYSSSNQGYFTPEERTAFLAKYAEGNATVAREYLGREDGVLFNDKFPQHIVSITNPSTADVIQVFMPALVEISKRIDTLQARNAALAFEIHRLKRPWKIIPIIARKIKNKLMKK